MGVDARRPTHRDGENSNAGIGVGLRIEDDEGAGESRIKEAGVDLIGDLLIAPLNKKFRGSHARDGAPFMDAAFSPASSAGSGMCAR